MNTKIFLSVILFSLSFTIKAQTKNYQEMDCASIHFYMLVNGIRAIPKLNPYFLYEMEKSFGKIQYLCTQIQEVIRSLTI